MTATTKAPALDSKLTRINHDAEHACITGASWDGMTEELTDIADDMTALLPKFVDGGSISGLILPTEHSAKFRTLAIDAKSILDDELGRLNDYSMGLLSAVNSGAGGFTGGPSYASVEEAAEIVRSAIRAIGRKRAKPTPVPARPALVESARPEPTAHAKSYVAPERIRALQALGGKGKWDFSRLLELCRELNVVAEHRCHMATAMLLRTIINHVPPILGFGTFAEVANNYGGPKSEKSFKAAMQRLEGSSRSIADMHLHSAIRGKEDVPTGVQVDFAPELDVLLGEVIRVSRP